MATANIPETPSRVNRPARGLDAFFANYAETTRKGKEEAATARQRVLNMPSITEGHESGKWWLCIVFAPDTSETEPRRLHWCFNRRSAKDFARDYKARGCYCVIAQTSKQPGDDF